MAERLFIELADIVQAVKDGRRVDVESFITRVREYAGGEKRVSKSEEKKRASVSKTVEEQLPYITKLADVPPYLMMDYTAGGYLIFEDGEEFVAEYHDRIKDALFDKKRPDKILGIVLGIPINERAKEPIASSTLKKLLIALERDIDQYEYLETPEPLIPLHPLIELAYVQDDEQTLFDDINKVLGTNVKDADELFRYANLRSTSKDTIINMLVKFNKKLDGSALKKKLKADLVYMLGEALLVWAKN